MEIGCSVLVLVGKSLCFFLFDMSSCDDPVAKAAIQEIMEIYRLTDPEQTDDPLSGADVVDELGFWIERNHKLLRKLGLVPDPFDQ